MGVTVPLSITFADPQLGGVFESGLPVNFLNFSIVVIVLLILSFVSSVNQFSAILMWGI